MDKHTLRMTMIRQLKTCTASARQIASQRACQNLLDGVDWSTITRVYCYQSQAHLNEIATSWLIEQLRSRHHIAVDVAPQTRNAVPPSAQYDLIIVPLVAFTSDGHRLGRGGGWYDRLLTNQSNAQKIGLAYDLQRVSDLPNEPHDIALDAIFTELQTYTS